jgi:hypothetical protein
MPRSSSRWIGTASSPLFYGPRAFIADAARRLTLEGFFAAPNTGRAWSNYSLGSATLTVSPEDRQTA